MTRQQTIDLIAEMLWTRGIGSRKNGPLIAAAIVDRLIKEGVLTVAA